MNPRIKDQEDNVVYVNFTPEELGEDYIQEEEGKLLNDYYTYSNRNMIVSTAIIGIILSAFIFFLLLGVLVLLTFA